MARIRVNPSSLISSAFSVVSIASQVSKIGDGLLHATHGAPSYSGQFGPRVVAIALSSLAHAKKNQGLLTNQSSLLKKKASAFQSADSTSIANLRKTSLFPFIDSSTYLRLLSIIMGISIAQLMFLLKLGFLKIPFPSFPWSIISLGNNNQGIDKTMGTESKDNTEQDIEEKENIGQENTKYVPVTSPFIGGYKITGTFGTYGDNDEILHQGLDIKPKNGSKDIHPIGPGKIIEIDYDEGGYGHHIVIEHELSDGRIIQSTYAHLKNRPDIEEGVIVTNETIIGEMGNSGHSTGDHLHLDIHEKGKASYEYTNQTSNYKNISPLDKLPNGQTRLDEMKDHWINPEDVLNGESNWEFVNLE